MEWSIQQIARLAGTTSRTLRHYDAIGLLSPSRVGASGYRYYDGDALVRLQRILLLRELGIGLPQIAEVLERRTSPEDALRVHLEWLRRERERTSRQIASVEATIASLEGGEQMMAEKMFDVAVETIERAWIEQYCRFSGPIDLTQQQFDSEALQLINRRQAWQFEILPIRYENGGELLMAASRRRLARAVTFVARRLEPVVYFRVADSRQLREFLMVHYPMPEVTAELLKRAAELNC